MNDRLENLKADNFRYFSNYEWLSDWEDFLTSGYWKSWQTKIPVFQDEKELIFYTQRLGEIANLISRCRKYGIKEEENADLLLIKQEETRLQNISHEDWKKEYKFSDTELKEMGVEEIEKEFGKDIDELFGLENKSQEEQPKEKEKPSKKESDNNIDYKSWTKEQLISEINRLKSENEQLKNNQNLTNSEKQERLQKNQQRLEQLESIVGTNNSSTQQPTNNNFLTPLLVGGIAVLALGILFGLLISERSKKVKK